MGQLENLDVNVRLTIANPDAKSGSMFGKGIAALCQGVREQGSLNAAAKHMSMAYSKAWRIIRDTESTLGIKLLDRDGAHGSTLTDEGNRLLDAYLRIEKETQDQAQSLYDEIMK